MRLVSGFARRPLATFGCAASKGLACVQNVKETPQSVEIIHKVRKYKKPTKQQQLQQQTHYQFWHNNCISNNKQIN